MINLQKCDDGIMSYLSSMQSEKAIQLHSEYQKIRRHEGMYGCRPAIHIFTFDINYQGKEYSGRGEQIYTYTNFENKYGNMPSIVEFTLRTKNHAENICTYVFESDTWREVYDKLSRRKNVQLCSIRIM